MIKQRSNTPIPAFSAFNKLSKGSLFQDDSCVSFFRRGCFSPEGTLLFLPVGLSETGQNAFHVLPRNQFGNPAPLFTLAGFDKPVIAIRCCPVLFERRLVDDPIIDIPYRIVFAVMTMDSIYIFDTEQPGCIWSIGGLHYAALTDISWSADGRKLMVSSVDGFCSLIEMGPDDLGSTGIRDKSQVLSMLKSRIFQARPQSLELASSEPDIRDHEIPTHNIMSSSMSSINQLIPKKRSMLSESIQ